VLCDGASMSELDSYLLVTLSCVVCGFYIGMGQMLMAMERNGDQVPSADARVVFHLSGLVGIGYLLAWLWSPGQPLFKFLPALILAYLAGMFGAALTKDKITAWAPATGLVVMPVMFHGTRYFGLTG
jgi:hypothetical protein